MGSKAEAPERGSQVVDHQNLKFTQKMLWVLSAEWGGVAAEAEGHS